MRLLPSSLAVGVSLALFAAPAAAQPRTYAATGPHDVETRPLPGGSTRVVVPKSGTPAPLVIASHGWSANGDHQAGWAAHFASWGFVVAVPSFPSSYSPDTSVNARIVGELVAQLTGADAAKYGVAPGRFGLEGHSAGGLATTVAAKALAPAAVVLFDPVDKDGAGAAALADLCSPVLELFAQPSSCNNQAGWKAFAGSAKGDVLGLEVKGSTHCDGENAPRGLCGPFCGGGASAERQAVYAHYATAFLLANLKDDAQASQVLVEAAVAADTGVSPVVRKASTCAPPATADAGARPDGSAQTPGEPAAAPSTSASPSPDADAPPGAGGAGEDALANGDGCAVASPVPVDRGLALAGPVGLTLAALARRRRRVRG